ncbi:MAG: gephyrin-like molybdotransferase Glp [Erythrobacter sp.]
MKPMLSLEEAQERALSLVQPMGSQTLPVEQALGRYLAQELLAQRTQPPANLSAMDGYAIGSAGPWKLIGESRAGTPFDGTISAGDCIRISTGAHVPHGADRILIQENVEIAGDQVSCVEDFPTEGRHIRFAGFDFEAQERVLPAGTAIGAAQIALAITAGFGEVEVSQSPTVAILDSGDELVADPTQCGPHQIPASNGAMIAAMVRGLGCEVLRLGPVSDDRDALAEALNKAENADFLVTTGGASVGDHDLMQPALEAWGADLDFWKVAMKPGKPVMVGRRGTQMIFGLPGNPVSSYVTSFLFVLPALRKAMGAADPLPRVAKLPAGISLPAIGSRREFLRGIWDGSNVKPGDSQDSSALRALAAANCLIHRPANAGAVTVGELVPVFMLENG